ncbi:MAG: YraN family protein [Sandaracinaceae bacterium]
MERARTGRVAEDLVARWLCDRGFVIVGRNVRVGRLELDLVARRGALLVVCEVRARRGSLVDPAETFDAAKRERTRRAALQVWTRHGRGCALRLDAAAVTFDAEGAPRLRYYEDVFALET